MAPERPSPEVQRRISSLYDRAETDTGNFNATRAMSKGGRTRFDSASGRAPRRADPVLESVAKEWFDVARAQLGPSVPAALPPDRVPRPARSAGAASRRGPAEALGLGGPGGARSAPLELTAGPSGPSGARAVPELPSAGALPAGPVAELTAGSAATAVVDTGSLAQLPAGAAAALPGGPTAAPSPVAAPDALTDPLGPPAGTGGVPAGAAGSLTATAVLPAGFEGLARADDTAAAPAARVRVPAPRVSEEGLRGDLPGAAGTPGGQATAPWSAQPAGAAGTPAAQESWVTPAPRSRPAPAGQSSWPAPASATGESWLTPATTGTSWTAPAAAPAAADSWPAPAAATAWPPPQEVRPTVPPAPAPVRQPQAPAGPAFPAASPLDPAGQPFDTAAQPLATAALPLTADPLPGADALPGADQLFDADPLFGPLPSSGSLGPAPAAAAPAAPVAAPAPAPVVPAESAAAPAVDASPASAYERKAAKALAFARAQIGKPCVWGATGPDSYDCSSLTQAAWRAAGVALPRTAPDQAVSGTPVQLAELHPGDLVFFYADASHVGLYGGNGTMVHAPSPGASIREESVFFAGPQAIHSAIRPA
ncbi:C40 family peptidase [Streptomyces sp. NPDC004065]|uniref:C40 family peptidase n=1 Tax=Streptomyces sp. NPDC004065 TaxID=3364689 RepID=UPI0038513617